MQLPESNIPFRVVRAALFLALLCSLPARALDPATPFRQYIHNSWDSQTGLPQDAVQTILQTRRGYLWIGTQLGLVRFNGLEFAVIPRFAHSDVRVLLEKTDSSTPEDEALWVGTYGEGLAFYNKGQVTFYTTNQGLPGNVVWALAEDARGNLWIGTDQGLAVLHNGEIARYAATPELATMHISSLAAAPDGAVWAVAGGSVFRIDQDQKAVLQFQASPRQSGEIIRDATVIAFDAERALWIGTAGRGVFRFDQDRLAHYFEPWMKQLSVTSIRQDSKNILWIGFFEGGLCRLQSQRCERYAEKDGLSSNTVSTTYEDREGSLWIGTFSNGLNQLRDRKFLTYSKNHSDSVTGIYEGHDGSIWAGTAHGLNRLYQGKITSYSVGSTRRGNSITAVTEDRKGFLWIGTEDGLKQFRNGRVIRTYRREQGLASNYVYALLEDRAGNLWIGDRGSPDREGGLTRMTDGKFTVFAHGDGLITDHIRTVFEDHQGNLWFATSMGVTELTSGRFVNFTIQGPPGEGPPGEGGGATCFYEDARGDLWVGTWGSGIVRIRNGTVTALSIDDTVFKKQVWSLLGDDAGSLWITSDLGLFRINLSDLWSFADGKSLKAPAVTKYGVPDGLLSPEFNGSAQAGACKTRSGKLLFANSRGVVEANPNNMPQNKLEPPVVVEEITIDGQPFVEGAGGSAGKSRIESIWRRRAPSLPSRDIR